MSTYILLVLGLAFSSIYLLSYFSINKQEIMLNMVNVMAFCMSFGLCIGGFLGSIFFADMLKAIFLAMFFSSISGLLLGILFHFAVAMEGFFSGIMAGMMGAMTTVMLPMQEGTQFVFFTILLTVTITLFLFTQYLPGKAYMFIKKHFFLYLLLCCFILITIFFTFPKADMDGKSEQHHHVIQKRR